MSDLKQFEKQIKEIREAYKMIFESDEGKKVLSDLEKRCHFFRLLMLKEIVMKVHIWKVNVAYFYLLNQCYKMITQKVNNNVTRTDNTGNCACSRDNYTPTEETKQETQIEQPVPTVAKSWKEAIPEELRNDPNISKFTELESLAKSYVNATRMIGQDKVAVPNNNSTEDQWNEVYDKLGRPESADKYQLDVKSDVVPLDESAIKSFAENAHQLGLNNKQAQGILEFYKNSMESSAQQNQVDMETAQAQCRTRTKERMGW